MSTRLILVLFFCALWWEGCTQPVRVSIEVKNNQYKLLRAGKPYFIKGAGGDTHLDELARCGGNSIRTWSAENAAEILDEAHENGLTVMLGLWLQHERHGFDYSDSTAVAKQLAKFTKIVEKHKNHPALLLWGIGNELDLFYTNTKVWDAVQQVAAMIHRRDPHHPTTTITAGLDPREVALIMEKAPDIDIYGINTYGAISEVAGSIRKHGWNGPYIIAEWGPNGHWEVPTTPWDAPLEFSSSVKAQKYAENYPYVKKDSAYCLGSYVFLWGQKQEVTNTYYGLFTERGNRTEAVDALEKAWNGHLAKAPAPRIISFALAGKSLGDTIILNVAQQYTARVKYQTSKNNVSLRWRVFPESEAESEGGDYQPPIPEIPEAVEAQRVPGTALLTTPAAEGAYRLQVFITGNNGKTAYANLPFYVKSSSTKKPQYD